MAKTVWVHLQLAWPVLLNIAYGAFHACLHSVIICYHSLEDDVIFHTVFYHVVTHELFDGTRKYLGRFPVVLKVSLETRIETPKPDEIGFVTSATCPRSRVRVTAEAP